MQAGTLYASAEAIKRSMKIVEVSGYLIVITSTTRSRLAARICDCFDKLEDLRMI
ncbi:MAG: hypothetical protein BWY67_02510 [Bacteroidetes bacterium ADurb.Bin397]|nr:MAG: hypothetical protein BWY67_02510 [Bacteroidetes bacterium ADurb.Bin397]